MSEDFPSNKPEVISQTQHGSSYRFDSPEKFEALTTNGDPENAPYTKDVKSEYVEAIDNGTHYEERKTRTNIYDNRNRLNPEPNDWDGAEKLSLAQVASKSFPSGRKVKTRVVTDTHDHWPVKGDKGTAFEDYFIPDYGTKIKKAERTITHPDGTIEKRAYSGDQADRMARAAERLSVIYRKRREANSKD